MRWGILVPKVTGGRRVPAAAAVESAPPGPPPGVPRRSGRPSRWSARPRPRVSRFQPAHRSRRQPCCTPTDGERLWFAHGTPKQAKKFGDHPSKTNLPQHLFANTTLGQDRLVYAHNREKKVRLFEEISGTVLEIGPGTGSRRWRRALATDGLVVGVLPAVGKLVGDALVAVDAGLVVLGRLAVEPLGAPPLLLDVHGR